MKNIHLLGREGFEAQLEFAKKDRFVLLGDIGFVLFLPAWKHKADDSHLLLKKS